MPARRPRVIRKMATMIGFAAVGILILGAIQTNIGSPMAARAARGAISRVTTPSRSLFRSSPSSCHSRSSKMHSSPIRGRHSVAATAEPEPCKLDDIEQCSVAELQVLYVDALWNYYNGGKALLSDEEFDRIKTELCWQGSGFPTLRRWEVEFVQAALSYYRGEPVVSNEKYEELKQKVKDSGKRQDVTAMLLYTKGQESLSPEQFQNFADEMRKLGMDVCIQGKDLQCTLSDTTDQLQNDAREVIAMYSAIGLIPQGLMLSAWGLLTALVGGPGALLTQAGTIPAAGLAGAGLTAVMIKYLGLDKPEVLLGTCPCCESEVRAFFGPQTPNQQDVKCETCGTPMTFSSEDRRIVSAGGFSYLTDDASASEVNFNSRDIARDVASALSNSLPSISSPELRKSSGKKLKKGEKEPLAEQLSTGIFAWAVLLGYGLFGEQFVGRVRGKGIALHSGVINDFCKRFYIPNKMRQKYIQTAKKNGHDLGFLVPGGYFGDGLAGEAAMKWWKSTGW